MGKLRIVGVVAGLVLVSGVVLQVSSAAFTGSAQNTGNSWDAGTVSFDDTNPAGALFTASNIKPGYTATQCIEVTYDGSITPASGIRFGATVTESNDGDGNGLGDDLDVVVKMAAAGVDCNPLASLVGSTIATTTIAGLASGTTTSWIPTGGTPSTRAFEITVTLGSDTADDAQGDGVDATFTWSATS